MARRTKVTLHSSGIAELLRSEGVAGHLRGLAAGVAASARASAPQRSGAYADSIHVEVVQRRDRSVARVVADAPHAALVEARTGNLARALGGAG